MRIRNGATGKSYFRKLRRRVDEPGQARELTFSCYKRLKFLDSDRTRNWFIDELAEARRIFPFDLWAYVIMPEHVHLLIRPREVSAKAVCVVGKIKEQVARRAIRYLKENAPEWLDRISAQEGNRMRYRFWQPGGGYDRNVVEISTVQKMVEYIHMNPVRRGLATHPEDWPWSSARWYAGAKHFLIDMDKTIPMIHEVGSKFMDQGCDQN